MDQTQILIQTQQFIRNEFLGETTGHDYYHIKRVVEMAKKIASEEKANLFLVEISAWLHDLGDYKLHDGVDKSTEMISEFLVSQKMDNETIQQVLEIVSQVSFSKGNQPTTLEAKIVQDADRLDAIGAIGLARTFAYGGHKNHEIYNPEKPENTSIQHFYDKLLKLKDLMNTPTAQNIAKTRHQYLEEFLEKFYEEWNF